MSAGWILIPLFQILSVVILITVFFAILFGAIFTAAQSGAMVSSAALIASLIGLIVLFGIVGFILSILFAYVLYRLVKRRNTHFARQSMLYEDLERVAREVSGKKGVDLSVQLNNLDRLRREAQLDESPRDPVLWSVILVFAAGFANTFNSFNLTGGPVSTFGAALIPAFAMYYVYYFLMKDLFRHERREDWFFSEFTRVFAGLGINIALPQRLSPVPDRSLIVYIILTIVTIGFFGVYWVYVLISDPNNHFRYQSMVEDTIMAQVSPVVV
jgi:Domain of unknown function (DUF4234)